MLISGLMKLKGYLVPTISSEVLFLVASVFVYLFLQFTIYFLVCVIFVIIFLNCCLLLFVCCSLLT